MEPFPLVIFVAVISAASAGTHSPALVPKAYNGKVFIHIMPWFETKETNNGTWGQHWTMANMDPDIVDENGKRQIAAHYYPEIGPYASGDEDVVEYQLNLMKYAGVDGIFIDWPGTLEVWDYPGNKRNSEVIIRVAQRLGLKYAIVYEDHNVGMAADAGLITDRIGAAQNDMTFLRDNYFQNSHYETVNGAPLLLDFGPQTFQSGSEWADIFSVFQQPPTFTTLWGESHEAGEFGVGEFCWIWVDFLLGLDNFYKYREVPFKIGGAYPGFHTFYALGGWPGDGGWSIPVGTDSFIQTLELALNGNVSYIQLNTWNDYGEGTMLEPTQEFGNQFLTILQQKLGVKYTERELILVRDLYLKRKEFKFDSTKQDSLRMAAKALNELRPNDANRILSAL